MWWRNIFAFILLFFATCISLTQFFVRDHLGSKIFAFVFFILSSCAVITVVRDFIKKRNEK